MNKKDFDHIDKLAQEAFNDFEVDYNPSDWFDFQEKLNTEIGIDEMAKDALQNYAVPYNEADWNSLEKELDKRKYLFPYITRVKTVEIGVLALLVFAFFNMTYQQRNNNLETILNSKNENKSTLKNNSSSSVKPIYQLETPSKEVQNEKIATPQATNTNIAIKGTSLGTLSLPVLAELVATQKQNRRAEKVETTKGERQGNNSKEAGQFSSLGVENGGNPPTNSINAMAGEQAFSNLGGLEQEQTDLLSSEEQNLTSTKELNQNEILASKNNLTSMIVNPISVKENVLTASTIVLEPILELKNVQKYNCRIHFGVNLSTDANLATSMGGTSIGYSGGFFADIELSAKFFVKTGLNMAHKKYFATTDYQLDRTTIDGHIYAVNESKTTNLGLVQLPLDIQYIFFKDEKWKVYLSTGLTANIVASRIYEGSQNTSLNGLSISTSINSQDLERGAVEGGIFTDNIYLSLGGGLGVERKLGDKVSLYLLPNYKHGVTPLGSQKDILGTFSLNVGLKTTL